jgi:polyisoprenyl-teichoic acid--peptidoglycan teichoic acid transferase
VSLASTRLVLLLGVLLAAFGLWGYIHALDPLGPIPLSEAEAALINPEGESFQASFVVAGRDIDYAQASGAIIRDSRGRVIGRTQPASGVTYSNRTDSIFYVQIVGTKVHVVAIPRDIWLDEHQIKINSVNAYRHLGAEGLRSEVSKLLGVPVQYHAIINIDIFERLIDAIGGVEVYVPYDMKYDDFAAQLHIDFKQGPRYLDGADAAAFVRYRGGSGGDYRRIDNIKLLGAAMVDKFRSFDLRAFAGLPEVLTALFEEIDTNADPAMIRQLLSRAGRLEVVGATLPAHDDRIWVNDRVYGYIPQDIQVLDPDEVERFLAETFGGTRRLVERAPEAELIITNRSGWAGLEEAVKARLVTMGIPEERIFTQELTADTLPSRVQAERESWESAEYFANMLSVQRFQVYRVNRHRGSEAALELILGRDALEMLPYQAGGISP